MNVNRVFFAGRLTRDPQVRFLPSQSSVCEFTVVSNRRYPKPGGQPGEMTDEATFMDVVAYGAAGQHINQHWRKGKEIYVEGRLKYESWEDKQGGGKRSKVLVVVEKHEFVGAATAVDQQQHAPTPTPPQRPRPAAPTQPRPPLPSSDGAAFQDDDIPF